MHKRAMKQAVLLAALCLSLALSACIVEPYHQGGYEGRHHEDHDGNRGGRD